MFDRIWWWANHKPAKKWVPYLSTLWTGFCAGFIAFPGVILLSQYPKLEDEWWLAIVFIALALVIFIPTLFWDRGNGQVDAAYEAYLRHREAVGKRIGKI